MGAFYYLYITSSVRMILKITKRKIEETRGGIKIVFCNGFNVRVHVGLCVYSWILRKSHMHWVESWPETLKGPPSSNAT